MREPVVVFVKGQLLLPRSVRPHAPDLHRPADVRIIVNVFSVGRILRAVYMGPGIRRKRRFVIVLQRNTVQVVYRGAVALADKGKLFSIGGPAMKIRRRRRGDLPWLAAAQGQHKDKRARAVGS